MHVHTDHKSLRYLNKCPLPLAQRQARWPQSLEEYNHMLWYGLGLENPAADACSCLTSQHLMDIENATLTRAFVIPLVENWAPPEGESVDGSCMYSRTRCHTMRCGPNRTTTCTFRFEADALWGRNLMLTNMRNQPSNSTLSPPSSQRTWSRYHQTQQPSSRRAWSQY